MIRIAMWSGPRNISTAMMRAWENRADCQVWDEPFYAHYLRETGADHPLREACIADGEADWRAVAVACAHGASPVGGAARAAVPGAALFYQKHMTHHMLPTIGLDWLSRVRSVFLIRRPEAVIASYHDRRAEPTMDDLGFERQAALFDIVTRQEGAPPPVIDAADVLADPEGTLTRLCARLDVPFDPAMLSWPAGPRAADGAWAPHWYGSVAASTGFAPPPRAPRVMPAHLAPLARTCAPFYERLAVHRLR